jgi:hypothetical protein
MALSGTYDFDLIQRQIIRQALLEVGGIAQHGIQSPAQQQNADASVKLNSMVKAWRGRGVFLWTIDTVQVSIIAGTSEYSLDSNIVGIDNSAFIRLNSLDTPLTKLTRKEYNNLGNKSTEGKPNQYFFDRNLSGVTITVYPVPDVDYTAFLPVYRFAQDIDGATNDNPLGQEWMDALYLGLANRLAPSYGRSSNFLKREAEEAFFIAKGMDEESGDLQMQPNLVGF